MRWKCGGIQTHALPIMGPLLFATKIQKWDTFQHLISNNGSGDTENSFAKVNSRNVNYALVTAPILMAEE